MFTVGPHMFIVLDSHSKASHVCSTLLSWCRVGRIINWTIRHSSEFILNLISFCLLPPATVPLLHSQPLIPSLCLSWLDLSLSDSLGLFLLDCFQIHPQFTLWNNIYFWHRSGSTDLKIIHPSETRTTVDEIPGNCSPFGHEYVVIPFLTSFAGCLFSGPALRIALLCWAMSCEQRTSLHRWSRFVSIMCPIISYTIKMSNQGLCKWDFITLRASGICKSPSCSSSWR